MHHILLADQVNVCKKGHENCGARSFCGTRLTIDTKEPYCAKCGDSSSSCVNNFNPGWASMSDSCNNNWNCIRSSESRDCFSVICEDDICTENAKYQQCFREEKRNQVIKNVGIALGVICPILLCCCCCRFQETWERKVGRLSCFL